MPRSQTSPTGDSVRSLDLTDFDLRFDRYRIIQPKAELLMARSLSKYSQLAPIIYCQMEGSSTNGIHGLAQQAIGPLNAWASCSTLRPR